ncbi:MAG: ABC transporter substrate-binding protein [Deltaproteobacteria bacterium]|nr:ABC transporter substrate-binding protein [Deltaproteobacteria bacterium]
MRDFRFQTAMLFLLLALVVGSTGDAEGKSYMAYISDAPSSSAAYWVAKEAGFFTKYGLDTELIFINGSTRGIQSLIAGDLMFTGAVGTAVINGRLAGGDIAIINSLENTLPYYIIGSSKIKSPEDLKGRSAAVHIPGTSADFALRLALQGVGVSYKDIKAVTVGGSPARIAAVMTGQLDFTVVTEPGRIEGERAGLKVIIDMAKLNIPFQFSCTVTTRKLIRENPDPVRRMVKAMAEAVHYYKTHKEQVIKIMGKYTRGQSRAALEGAFAAESRLYVEDTYPTLEGLKNTLEVQASWDPKASKARVEDFVDLRFVDELKKSGFIDQLYARR